MSQQIQTSQVAANAAIDTLRRDVDTFCAYRLTSLSGPIPTSGSGYHDGVLSSALSRAFEAYRAMMRADATMVQGVQQSLAAADATAASSYA